MKTFTKVLTTALFLITVCCVSFESEAAPAKGSAQYGFGVVEHLVVKPTIVNNTTTCTLKDVYENTMRTAIATVVVTDSWDGVEYAEIEIPMTYASEWMDIGVIECR